MRADWSEKLFVWAWSWLWGTMTLAAGAVTLLLAFGNAVEQHDYLSSAACLLFGIPLTLTMAGFGLAMRDHLRD